MASLPLMYELESSSPDPVTSFYGGITMSGGQGHKQKHVAEVGAADWCFCAEHLLQATARTYPDATFSGPGNGGSPEKTMQLDAVHVVWCGQGPTTAVRQSGCTLSCQDVPIQGNKLHVCL